MPNCSVDEMTFGRLGQRVIEANFQGGAISSDGGVMLLRQLDRGIGLSKAVAQALSDPRDKGPPQNRLRPNRHQAPQYSRITVRRRSFLFDVVIPILDVSVNESIQSICNCLSFGRPHPGCHLGTRFRQPAHGYLVRAHP